MPLEHRHIFTYEITESDDDEFPVQTVTREIEGDATLTGLLEAFKEHLQGCGFIIDGDLGIVPEQVYEVAVPPKVVKDQFKTRTMHKSMRVIKK